MISSIPGSFLEQMRSGESGTRLFIVHNEPLERIMFDRNLMGFDFRAACLEASRFFIGHMMDEFDPEESAELMILSKGLIYQIGAAVAAEAGMNLPVNLIATSRVSVSAQDAKIEIPYARLEAPSRTLIIGDTVASGATITAAVDEYVRHHALERLYVVSFAGAGAGAVRISEHCRKLGIDVTFTFGLAAFGLGENGFDLSFLHEATATRDEYRRRAYEQFDGKPVSAVGWDFGSQAMAPRKYRELCWVEAEMWDLHDSPCLSRVERPDDLSRLRHESAAYSQINGSLRQGG